MHSLLAPRASFCYPSPPSLCPEKLLLAFCGPLAPFFSAVATTGGQPPAVPTCTISTARSTDLLQARFLAAPHLNWESACRAGPAPSLQHVSTTLSDPPKISITHVSPAALSIAWVGTPLTATLVIVTHRILLASAVTPTNLRRTPPLASPRCISWSMFLLAGQRRNECSHATASRNPSLCKGEMEMSTEETEPKVPSSDTSFKAAPWSAGHELAAIH
jgi:hypothetical protein